MSKVEKTCACGTKYMARAADLKRGWARSCSKSCAATKREKITGNYARYQHSKKVAYYAREYGGQPQFDCNGEYVGFCDIFSNEDHDCNKD